MDPLTRIGVRRFVRRTDITARQRSGLAAPVGSFLHLGNRQGKSMARPSRRTAIVPETRGRVSRICEIARDGTIDFSA
jgi:hypothetical protein